MLTKEQASAAGDALAQQSAKSPHKRRAAATWTVAGIALGLAVGAALANAYDEKLLLGLCIVAGLIIGRVFDKYLQQE